jgi:hypothetical protein
VNGDADQPRALRDDFGAVRAAPLKICWPAGVA